MSHSDRADKAEHALARVVAEIDGSGPTEAREQARQEAILAQIEQLKLSSADAIEVISSISQDQLSDIRKSLDRGSNEQGLELTRLAELAGMRQERIDSLLGQIEALSAEVFEFRAREAEHAAAGTEREIVVATLNGLVESREQRSRELASQLAAEVESRAEFEKQLRNEIEELDNRWRSEAAARAQLELEFESLGQVVVRMDEAARTLSDNVTEQAAIAARLELERNQLIGLLAERDRKIVSLSADISAAEAEAVRQARQVAANDAEILSLSMQCQALETRWLHSQEAVAKRDGEIEVILASKSWKTTAPLRWMAGIWRKLFDV
jgi:chromosome segregation ATPase